MAAPGCQLPQLEIRWPVVVITAMTVNTASRNPRVVLLASSKRNHQIQSEAATATAKYTCNSNARRVSLILRRHNIQANASDEPAPIMATIKDRLDRDRVEMCDGICVGREAAC